MTMTGVTGTMLITSLTLATSTFSNVACTIPSQTTASIPIGRTVTIRKARALAANVFYNANVNRFVFTAYSNVEVTPGLATFWGLDPKNFDSVLPTGNLNYIISATSAHPSLIGTPPFPAFPRASADFTLEQGGWSRGSGIPAAEKRAGIYFLTEQAIEPSLTPTAVQFQMYGNYLFYNTARNLYISQVAGSTFCFQSTNGNIAFTKAGQYCIRGNLTAAGTDAVFSVAYT
jgi:hypothetical protein